MNQDETGCAKVERVYGWPFRVTPEWVAVVPANATATRLTALASAAAGDPTQHYGTVRAAIGPLARHLELCHPNVRAGCSITQAALALAEALAAFVAS